MELLVFIVILILVIKLDRRVRKLEQFIKSGISQRTLEPSYKSPAQQPEIQRPTIPESLFNYIKQQLKQGKGEEEIKNSLLANGWQISDVEKAFNAVITQVHTPMPMVTLKQEEPTLFDKFVEWLEENWLLKLGALLLLIAFGWFTTYAFLHNWIGPMGRITLGIIAGVLFLLLGWWRIKNYPTQGGILLVLGSTTILLVIYAARAVYNFFTPLSALIVMFLSTAFVALASVKYNNRPLSLLSLTLASIAPLLTKSPTTNEVGLFSYLFVVILGAIWIVILTGQRELTAASLIIISLYSLPPLLSPSSHLQILLLFAYAFASLFFVTNTIGILELKDRKITLDIVTAAGNGLFLLAWIMTAVKDEWKSLIISVWMIIFIIAAFLIFRATQRQEPFYVYAGVGIIMLAAATSAELKGPTLTIAYTIESGLIPLITYLVLRDIKIAERFSLLLIGPVIMSFNSIFSSAWVRGVIHKDFFVLLVLALTLLGLGAFFIRRVKEIEDKETYQINIILLIVGSVYLYVLLWLSLHAAFVNNNMAVMISLLIYTIIGLITYFYGWTNEKETLRVYGGTLIGFVVGRLLLVDVWKMELAARIVTFFLIGALLVSTAFWLVRPFGKGKNEIRK